MKLYLTTMLAALLVACGSTVATEGANPTPSPTLSDSNFSLLPTPPEVETPSPEPSDTSTPCSTPTVTPTPSPVPTECGDDENHEHEKVYICHFSHSCPPEQQTLYVSEHRAHWHLHHHQADYLGQCNSN